MGSYCVKTFFGKKRIFKSCGRCIKPSYESIGYGKRVAYDENRQPVIDDAFKNAEFLQFLKDNPNANYLCMVEKDTNTKYPDYYKCWKVDNKKRFYKHFNAYTFDLIYDTLSAGEVMSISKGLKSDTMYW